MKKIVCCAMVLLMMLAVMPVSAAESFIRMTASSTARVAEVIDGDALLVRGQNGQAALVKLIGVDTLGRVDAHEFLTEKALGADILFVLDSNVPWDGRWNYCYAYKTGELLNGSLLQNGYGQLNPAHERASLYSSLRLKQNIARAARIGIWEDPAYPGGTIVSGLRVNINTATASQLAANLPGLTSSVAAAMVSYREKNPFRTVEDVKYVRGMTRAMFNQSRGNMIVATDIRTATQEELGFLRSVSSADAAKIAAYRLRNGVTDLRNLVTNGCISLTQYENNLPFMTLEETLCITRTEPMYTANINTATKGQLTNAGLTSVQADRLLDQRGRYAFKSLYDAAAALSLGEEAVNLLGDNLTVWTDVNLASEYELRTLFGTRTNAAALAKAIYEKQPFARLSDVQALLTAEEYNLIAPYICLHTVDKVYVNANTASVAQMTANGITNAAANRLAEQAGKMNMPNKIPSEAQLYAERFTLYTNINTASYEELMSLHKDMSVLLVNTILDYRLDQPFGSRAEIQKLFTDMRCETIYNAVNAFLVTR